ncbi:MAG: non-ribosomal peptide synthetase, partial [Flavobacterium sp.]
LQYVGRKDKQVKIRGYRVELSEIEIVLNTNDGVRDSLAILHSTESNQPYICVYIVAGDHKPSVESIRTFLLRRLPGYMVPGRIIFLDRWPLTFNGKIDKSRLPDPGSVKVEQEGLLAPFTDLQCKISKIWQLILSRDQVGINENFFEIGGHSLSATELVTLMHKDLNVKVELAHIFNYPTIEQLSNIVSELVPFEYHSIPKSLEKSHYFLSAAQRRLYVLYQLDQSSLAYNMPIVFKVKAPIQEELVLDAFLHLISRHDSLRTSIRNDGHIAVQFVEPVVDFCFDKYEEGLALDEVVNRFVRPFNLAEAPLFRAAYQVTSKNEYLIFVDMHHIVSDGKSMQILINDFIRIFSGI